MYEETVFMRSSSDIKADIKARKEEEKRYVRSNEKFFTLLKDSTGVHITASEVETYRVVDHLINDLHVEMVNHIPAGQLEELITLQSQNGLTLKTESGYLVLVIRGHSTNSIARKVAKLLLQL